jgi:hypothetical protein
VVGFCRWFVVLGGSGGVGGGSVFPVAYERLNEEFISHAYVSNHLSTQLV